MMEVFGDYAYYYNSFYQDKNYREEALQIDCLLKKYGKNVFTIINYGCGTGRHDVELAKLGYHCAGIDFSALMVELARENAKQEKLDIEFSVSDIRNYEPKKQYDAVISLFHVMSYQNTNEDIFAAFRSARKALSNGGLFLFDVWYGPGVLSDKPGVRVKEIEDDRNRLVRIARPVMHERENIVDVNYEVQVINKDQMINETHNMRYFFRPELQMLLEEAGFELLDNLDCNTLGKTSFDSWTSYFVAKAQ